MVTSYIDSRHIWVVRCASQGMPPISRSTTPKGTNNSYHHDIIQVCINAWYFLIEVNDNHICSYTCHCDIHPTLGIHNNWHTHSSNNDNKTKMSLCYATLAKYATTQLTQHMLCNFPKKGNKHIIQYMVVHLVNNNLAWS